MNLSTTPASSKVEAQVHQPSILNPNNCPSASLHRHPHHAWLKHRGADSYIGETKIQEEPHLCETSGSGELRPHKSLVGVEVNASKTEMGSEGLIPWRRRRPRLGVAAWKHTPRKIKTYSTLPGKETRTLLASGATRATGGMGNRRSRRQEHKVAAVRLTQL